jgi:ketosteroid isomerase-like protein
MKCIAMLVLLTSSTGVLASPGNSRVQEEIVRQEREWSVAFLQHDIAALDRIIADDFVGTDGRGVMSSKADEIQEARAVGSDAPVPPFVILDEVLSEMHVRLYGGVAVLTSRNDERVRAGDREMVLVYRRTTVWVKRQARWQCVSFHASRVQSH